MDWFADPAKLNGLLKDGIGQLYNSLGSFDGVWTTENEPYSAYLWGELPQEKTQAKLGQQVISSDQPSESYYNNSWYQAFNLDSSSTYYLPFMPQFKELGAYDSYSLSLNATHSGLGGATEFDLHSLNGHAMTQTFSSIMKEAKKYERIF